MKKFNLNPAISKREQENMEIAREIAAEGIVLLENDGVLPFQSDIKKIALFGNGARQTIKGGTGSGDVNVRSYITIEEGLEKAGYSIVSKRWLERYDEFIHCKQLEYDRVIRENAQKEGPAKALLYMMGNPFSDPEFSPLRKEDIETADAAVYVLARKSGEGADRTLAQGDYELTEQELKDIRFLAEMYDKFVVLLNIGGPVDWCKIKKVEGINALVNIGQGGSAFGDAVADILTGKVTPSGKLAMTWAKEYKDYPMAEKFATVSGEKDDVWYQEGIYVGYRYFDTFHVEPLYPFGYGKSYTDFTIETKSVTVRNLTVTVSAEVKNVGDFAGKEVVQIYISTPKGTVPKAFQTLCGYEKTNKLRPGETAQIQLSFPLERVASYDEKKAAYVLEEGEYILRVGNSSRNTEIVKKWKISEEICIKHCKNLFSENRSLREQKQGKNEIIEKRMETAEKDSQAVITFSDILTGKATIEQLTRQMTEKELILLCVGGARINMRDFSVIGNAADVVPGAAGETTKELLETRKIPIIEMADGPAGIRVNPKFYIKDGVLLKNPAEDPIFSKILPEALQKVDLKGAETGYQYCTALPIATMLAQSWNLKLLEKAGVLIGQEMEEMGIDLWLAPALNIQRNPLCGRNFEYYSEDPLVSGLCAAAVTKGVQSCPGRGTTIKHLAANNQETNRNYCNSHVSEQALREIYLKGFEICIQEAKPLAVMTSVNLLNGIHTANDRELLTEVLREEWGFEGMVMTDWGITSDFGTDTSTKKYSCASSVGCMIAGNDLIMPGSKNDEDQLLHAVHSKDLEESRLRWCAANILRVMLNLKKQSV